MTCDMAVVTSGRQHHMSILCLIGYATFPWGLSWALSGMEIFPFVTRVTLCDGADSAMNFNKGVNSSVLWEGSDKGDWEHEC